MPRIAAGALTLLASVLTGCALPPATPPAPLQTDTGSRLFNANNKMAWEAVTFPGKVRTAFSQQRHDGQDSVQADAKGSVSMLRQPLRVSSDKLGLLIFDWQVETLLPGANLAEPGQGDSPVRLVLAFEGDRQKFSARNAMLSELSQALTGEALPYATLMYVWSNTKPVGTVIVHPRTDRIRKIVVDSGPQHLRQWRHHQRDLRADYERAFGEPPGALQALAIMTDSDNTRSQTRAWYGEIRLTPGVVNPPSHAQR